MAKRAKLEIFDTDDAVKPSRVINVSGSGDRDLLEAIRRELENQPSGGGIAGGPIGSGPLGG